MSSTMPPPPPPHTHPILPVPSLTSFSSIALPVHLPHVIHHAPVAEVLALLLVGEEDQAVDIGVALQRWATGVLVHHSAQRGDCDVGAHSPLHAPTKQVMHTVSHCIVVCLWAIWEVWDEELRVFPKSGFSPCTLRLHSVIFFSLRSAHMHTRTKACRHTHAQTHTYTGIPLLLSTNELVVVNSYVLIRCKSSVPNCMCTPSWRAMAFIWIKHQSVNISPPPPLSHLKGSVVFVVLNHILKVASQHCIQVGHIICVGDVDVITETVSWSKGVCVLILFSH